MDKTPCHQPYSKRTLFKDLLFYVKFVRKFISLNDPLALLSRVFLLSFMVLAPLCSGGVAIHSRVCPPTKGARLGQGSRSRQGSALVPWTLRGQKQVAFSQTAASHLRSLGWPFISIIFVTETKQARVSLGAPTCKDLLCFSPLPPAYLPLLPPWGCRPHGPAVPAGR